MVERAVGKAEAAAVGVMRAVAALVAGLAEVGTLGLVVLAEVALEVAATAVVVREVEVKAVVAWAVVVWAKEAAVLGTVAMVVEAVVSAPTVVAA